MDQDTKNGENSDVIKVLQKLKTDAFDSSDEQLALALGRDANEIKAWLEGDEEIDEDAEMKIHGLAQERLSE